MHIMEEYAGLSVSKAIKTVRAHKGHRRQSGKINSFTECHAVSPLTANLQEELENYIDKANDITTWLQYLMLQDNGEDSVAAYKRDIAAMGKEDTELITRATFP